MGEVRLNKFLSDCGVCSRRQADVIIQKGRIFVNGLPAVLGMKIDEADQVFMDGKQVVKQEPPVLLAVNKPRGIVCTTAKEETNNIVDYIHYKTRIYPVGRLDKDSEGLILMTNQGELVNKILRGSNGHQKEYIVTINRPVTPAFIHAMENGVPILDTVTKPCKVEKLNESSGNQFRIILTQGLNRQIRRMCEYLGVRVLSLKRVRVLNIRLDGLKTGEYREITGKELARLLACLNGSSSLSYQERVKENVGRERHGSEN